MHDVMLNSIQNNLSVARYFRFRLLHYHEFLRKFNFFQNFFWNTALLDRMYELVS